MIILYTKNYYWETVHELRVVQKKLHKV